MVKSDDLAQAEATYKSFLYDLQRMPKEGHLIIEKGSYQTTQKYDDRVKEVIGKLTHIAYVSDNFAESTLFNLTETHTSDFAYERKTLDSMLDAFVTLLNLPIKEWETAIVVNNLKFPSDLPENQKIIVLHERRNCQLSPLPDKFHEALGALPSDEKQYYEDYLSAFENSAACVVADIQAIDHSKSIEAARRVAGQVLMIFNIYKSGILWWLSSSPPALDLSTISLTLAKTGELYSSGIQYEHPVMLTKRTLSSLQKEWSRERHQLLKELVNTDDFIGFPGFLRRTLMLINKAENEPTPDNRFLWYVIAIEQMTTPSRPTGDGLSSRVKAGLMLLASTKLEYAREIYNLRSHIAHGRIDEVDEKKIIKFLPAAEYLAKRIFFFLLNCQDDFVEKADFLEFLDQLEDLVRTLGKGYQISSSQPGFSQAVDHLKEIKIIDKTSNSLTEYGQSIAEELSKAK